eukprot:5106616-Pyramimonas_sp.AAC.1
MVDEGAATPAVQATAPLGCHGRCPQNEERDLHRWLQSAYGMNLKPHFLQIALTTKQVEAQKGQHPSPPLHEVFGQLHDAGKERFEKGRSWGTMAI